MSRRRARNRPKPVSDLMTIADVAEFCGLTVKAIRWHRNHGTLPHPDCMVGQSPYWRRATIKAWRRPPVGRPADTWTDKQKAAHSRAMVEHWHVRHERPRCAHCACLLSPDEDTFCRDHVAERSTEAG